MHRQDSKPVPLLESDHQFQFDAQGSNNTAGHPSIIRQTNQESTVSPFRTTSMSDFDAQSFLNLDHGGFDDIFMFDGYTHTAQDYVSPLRVAGDVINQSPQDARSPVVLEDNPDVSIQIIGHTADMDPFLMRQYQFDDNGRFRFKKLTIQSLDQGPSPCQMLISPRLAPVGNTAHQMRAQLEALIPPSAGDRLVSLFKIYVANQFPIFHGYPSASSASECILAALYLCVEAYIPFDEELSVDFAYDGLPRTELLQVFYQCLQPALEHPSIETVQALFLMVICPGNPLIFEAPRKWALHGMLIACAHTIGLHFDPNAWSLDAAQARSRRVLAALIFDLDHRLAASLGKPPLLDPNNWLVTTLERDPSLIHQKLDGLAVHIDLGELQVKVLRELFSLRAIQQLSNDSTLTLSRAKPLLEELRSWHRTFCATVKTPVPAADLDISISSPQQLDMPVFELGYYHIRLLTLRAVLRPFVASESSTQSNLSHSTNDTAFNEARRNARIGCHACTSDMLGYVKSLTPRHAAYTFWPPWASIVFSSLFYLHLLMLASSPDYDEAATCLSELQSLRSELRVKSASFPVMRLGLLRVDSLFWRGLDKVIALPAHVNALVTEKRMVQSSALG